MTGRVESAARFAIWSLLVVGWAVTVWLMWEALTTMSSADGPEISRTVAVPTLRTFFAAALFSGLELAVILALLWPWRAGYYLFRLAAAVLALGTWLLITVSLEVTRMDLMHRRWLVGMTVGLAVALVLLGVMRLTGRLRSSAARA